MEAKEDDIFLLKLISKGNEQAFKLLFETYFTPLCRFVRLYVRFRQSGSGLLQIRMPKLKRGWNITDINYENKKYSYLPLISMWRNFSIAKQQE